MFTLVIVVNCLFFVIFLNNNNNNKRSICPYLFGSVEWNSGLFSPLVRFVYVGVNTVIELGWGPKRSDRDQFEEVASVKNELWYSLFVV